MSQVNITKNYENTTESVQWFLMWYLSEEDWKVYRPTEPKQWVQIIQGRIKTFHLKTSDNPKCKKYKSI